MIDRMQTQDLYAQDGGIPMAGGRDRVTRSTAGVCAFEENPIYQNLADTEDAACNAADERDHATTSDVSLGKRKAVDNIERVERKRAKRSRQGCKQRAPNQSAADACPADDVGEDVHSDVESVCSVPTAAKKKKVTSNIPTAFKRMLEIEENSHLCVTGEAESSILPKKIHFMNHSIDVMYDSNVQMWLKADDFAKALGFKTYKSVIDRYVNPSFVRPYQEVLDMSRARFGDAFRLYPINSKVQFLHIAGVNQLLIRAMLSDESTVKDDNAQQEVERQDAPSPVVSINKGIKQQTKNKLSADWIQHKMQPYLLSYLEESLVKMEQRSPKAQ